MTQCENILKHLRKKPITALEALTRYGCICLAERIRDLREMGHIIVTEMVKQNNKRFAKYVLIKEKQ